MSNSVLMNNNTKKLTFNKKNKKCLFFKTHLKHLKINIK